MFIEWCHHRVSAQNRLQPLYKLEFEILKQFSKKAVRMNKGQEPPYFANPTTFPQPQPMNNQYVEGGPTVVIAAAPYVIPRYGPNPQPTTCPYCHKQITTRIQTDPTARTHMMAILCCIMCCLPCIPYCIDSCKNKNHYCPSCSAFLGSYDSMEGMAGYHGNRY